MNTQIKKIGNSKGIIIPAPIIKMLDLREFEELSLKVVGDDIILSKAEVFDPKSLDELFKEFNGKYEGEVVFDDVKGREIWWIKET